MLSDGLCGRSLAIPPSPSPTACVHRVLPSAMPGFGDSGSWGLAGVSAQGYVSPRGFNAAKPGRVSMTP